MVLLREMLHYSTSVLLIRSLNLQAGFPLNTKSRLAFILLYPVD